MWFFRDFVEIFEQASFDMYCMYIHNLSITYVCVCVHYAAENASVIEVSSAIGQ